jgi:transcriptional regulator with XRE-family HTH domain
MVEQSEKGLPVRYPEFAKRVQEAMESQKLTVRKVQARLKITYEMARRYTLGQAMPRQPKLEALAKLLHVDPVVLQFGETAGTSQRSSGKLRKVEPDEDKPTIEEAMHFFAVFEKLNRLDRADTMSFMENLVSLSTAAKAGTTNHSK